MKSDTALRALFICVALLGLQVVAHAQSTTWTGAVSTDWNNSANWSGGLPSATRDAVIALAPRGCVVPVTTTPVVARNLTVQAGASLDIPVGASLHLEGNLDVGSTIAGTGTLMVNGPIAATPRSIVFRNSASTHTLDVSGLFASNPSMGGRLDARDVTCRGDFLANTPCYVNLAGRTEVVGTLSNQPTTGIATVNCEPTGTLIAGTVSVRDDFHPPLNLRVARILLPTTFSAFATQTGSIVFGAQTTTTIISQGGYVGPMHILAGATVQFEGSGRLFGVLCEGSLVFEQDANNLQVTNLAVHGNVRFRGPNTAVGGQGIHLLQGTTQIHAGGSLLMEPGATTSVFVAGDPQVSGTLQLMGANSLDVGGTVHVAPTGTLRLSAFSFVPPTLSAWEIRVQGELYSADSSIWSRGPGGLQLLPGSRITSSFLTFLGSLSTDPSAVLLDISRTAPTMLSSMTLGDPNGSNPPKGVRASSPHPVQVSYSNGPRAGSAFEDDPLGVISWSDGVTYAGAATPGCLGLAECEATGDARLGNTSFAFRCRRAHPNASAIFLLGPGSTSTPASFGNLSLWFDPALPLTSVFRTADASGMVVSPQPIPNQPAFAGVVFTGQFVLFEPPGCTPSNLSASTASRIVLRL